MSSAAARVVVVGGGIHGVSVAYYLAKKGVSSLVIEQSSIAAAASGKSGGFLARDWGSGPTVQLHRRSFELHKQLADELHVQSYRSIRTLEVTAGRKGSNVATWLNGKVKSSMMDTHTAQVTPLELTEKMLDAARSIQIDGASAVEVLIDSVVGIERQPITDAAGGDQRVTGVRTKTHGVVAADRVVICMGPWSGVAVEDWFGLSLPMEGIKSSSIAFTDMPEMLNEPYACFCGEDKHGCHLELYPRPNGELYVCGLGGSDHVSGDRLRPGGDCSTAEEVQGDPRRAEAACRSLQDMCSLPESRKPDIVQACMRPCTPDGMPVMGVVPGNQGAYVSCGHNCWGILWAPVCGLAMAELIAHGAAVTVDLAPFTPHRYLHEWNEENGRGRKKGQAAVGEQW